MRNVVRLAAVAAVLAVPLAGCDTPNTRFADIAFGDAKGVAAGGNLRLVTQRPRPLPEGRGFAAGPWPVMCSEPMPDYVVAFGRSASGSLKGNIIAGAATEGEATVASTETANAGEGRTAGVLALRDGLYAACQAYTNGAIGQDAYSAILSQYGLLVAAVAASDARQAPAAAAQAPPRQAASAFSAVLVACLSAHDPSRPTPGGGNPILDRATCRRIVQIAGDRRRG